MQIKFLYLLLNQWHWETTLPHPDSYPVTHTLPAPLHNHCVGGGGGGGGWVCIYPYALIVRPLYTDMYMYMLVCTCMYLIQKYSIANWIIYIHIDILSSCMLLSLKFSVLRLGSRHSSIYSFKFYLLFIHILSRANTSQHIKSVSLQNYVTKLLEEKKHQNKLCITCKVCQQILSLGHIRFLCAHFYKLYVGTVEPRYNEVGYNKILL